LEIKSVFNCALLIFIFCEEEEEEAEGNGKTRMTAGERRSIKDGKLVKTATAFRDDMKKKYSLSSMWTTGYKTRKANAAKDKLRKYGKDCANIKTDAFEHDAANLSDELVDLAGVMAQRIKNVNLMRTKPKKFVTDSESGEASNIFMGEPAALRANVSCSIASTICAKGEFNDLLLVLRFACAKPKPSREVNLGSLFNNGLGLVRLGGFDAVDDEYWAQFQKAQSSIVSTVVEKSAKSLSKTAWSQLFKEASSSSYELFIYDEHRFAPNGTSDGTPFGWFRSSWADLSCAVGLSRLLEDGNLQSKELRPIAKAIKDGQGCLNSRLRSAQQGSVKSDGWLYQGWQVLEQVIAAAKDPETASNELKAKAEVMMRLELLPEEFNDAYDQIIDWFDYVLPADSPWTAVASLGEGLQTTKSQGYIDEADEAFLNITERATKQLSRLSQFLINAKTELALHDGGQFWKDIDVDSIIDEMVMQAQPHTLDTFNN